MNGLYRSPGGLLHAGPQSSKAIQSRIDRAWDRLERHDASCKGCSWSLPWETCARGRKLERDLRAALIIVDREVTGRVR